jgi:hypothetical protein
VRKPAQVELDGWLLLVITLIAGAIGMVSYSFTTFETSSHAKEQKDFLDRRLERIEEKIDKLLAK